MGYFGVEITKIRNVEQDPSQNLISGNRREVGLLVGVAFGGDRGDGLGDDSVGDGCVIESIGDDIADVNLIRRDVCVHKDHAAGGNFRFHGAGENHEGSDAEKPRQQIDQGKK